MQAPASPEPCGAGELAGWVQPWFREGWNPPPQCAGEFLVGWRRAGHASAQQHPERSQAGGLLAARGSARGAGDETERGLPDTVRLTRLRPSGLLDRPLQNRLTCRWPWWRLTAWQPAQNHGTGPPALSSLTHRREVDPRGGDERKTGTTQARPAPVVLGGVRDPVLPRHLAPRLMPVPAARRPLVIRQLRARAAAWPRGRTSCCGCSPPSASQVWPLRAGGRTSLWGGA